MRGSGSLCRPVLALLAAVACNASADDHPTADGRPTPSPPAAVGSADSGNEASVRIALPISGGVSTRVVSKEAGDVLAYGLAQPARVRVCTDCTPGETRAMGAFLTETQLVFFLSDRTVGLRWFSTNRQHARVRRLTPTEWRIAWDDSGGCNPACPDRDFNDLVTKVSLSPTWP